MAESSSPLEPNPSIINPIQHTIHSHSHSHSHMGMIPEYTNNTHLQELGQNSDTHITNLTDSPQINENKNMGFVGNCNIDNTQITNFTDLPKSDPLYCQKVEINDTQMTNVADLAESDPLYSQETQKNDTQMADFTDLPKSDSLNGRKQEKNEGLVGNVKKEKKVRKRGKGAKKDVVCDFERVTVCDCDKRGDRVRIVYLKDEIEALRYVGVEEQKRKWSEVYCGLGDVVAKEYDCLVGFKDDGGDGSYVDFDPRTRFSNKKGGVTEISGSEPDNKMQNTNEMDHLSGVDDSDLDVEEDYYEDEYSDSEDVSIQRPAFYVTGEPDFDSGPPQDGLEYLRRVRWETSHIPKVKVAKVEKNVLNKEQTVYMPNIPDIAACPEHLMPSKEWEDVFLADFSKLRLALFQNEGSDFTISGRIESIPLAHDIIENVIQENLDSYQTDDGTILMQENLDFIPTDVNTATIYDLPTLQTIMDMEPVARVTMLRKRISSLETLSSLGRTDCAWLFALCAAIDTPLDADTSASLRCLLRKCAALRAEKMCLDDEVIMLNILATISGKYFGQLQSN